MEEDPEMRTTLQAYVTEVHSPTGRVVLAKNVMDIVWSDMSVTVLPTWISRAPPNWGTAQRGKLSADNWRVICTIHLPITLIRLWNSATRYPEPTRMQVLLDHFMDLVSAVRIANMRVTSSIQIEEFTKHMTRYTARITTVFPDENLKPTHHTALHISEMLDLFGPNHSHSGPHYERYINFFHRVNTNKKIGRFRQCCALPSH